MRSNARGLTTPSDVPSARERLAVAALTLAAFGIALNIQVLGALAPFLKTELTLSKDQLGNLIAAGWIGGAAGALLLLPVADRLGRRMPLLVGLSVFAVASVGHLVAEDYGPLLVVRAVAGLSGGGVFTIASATVADLVPYARRGRAMGVFNLSVFLAVPIGMPLAVKLAGAGAWSSIFALQIVTSAFAVPVLWKIVPAGRGAAAGTGALDWGVFRLPHVVPALLSVIFYSGAFATATQFVGVWLDDSAIVAKDDQWLLWVVLGVVSAAGTFGLTRFADVIGKRRYVIVCSAVVAAGLAGLTAVSSEWVLIAIGVPVAACTASRSGAMLALISGLAPTERRGALMALRSVSLNAGMGIAVVVGGLLYDAAGYSSVLWYASAAVFVSMSLVIFSVKEGEA